MSDLQRLELCGSEEIETSVSKIDNLYRELGFKNGFVSVEALINSPVDVKDPLFTLITGGAISTNREIKRAVYSLKQLVLDEINLEKLTFFLKV